MKTNMKQNKPKISIITPSKNTGRFSEDTITTILAQTYKNWEHIVVDGSSSDETLEVLREYSHIRWISEEDSGPDEAFRKGILMAKGDYIMFCAFSDGYLDKNWFNRCVTILDRDSEISLVWGFPQYMSEDGSLGPISYEHFFDDPPPIGRDHIYYWLDTYFHFPEGNFCVRKNVMDHCFPIVKPKEIGKECEFLTYNYRFNERGYLPYFIPVVANYGRIHSDGGGLKQREDGRMKMWEENYYSAIENYKERLINGEIIHRYRDGFGNLLQRGFDKKKYVRNKSLYYNN